MEALADARAGTDRLIRVVLTGSESTGKTTLAVALARHYGTLVVPEFVRAFAEEKGGAPSFDDCGPIARGQIALEDERFAVARGVHRVIFLDTDLLSAVVYNNHYYGHCPEWIEDAARARRPDLYLLCETDVPWIADGVRDRGDRRDEMQALFRAAVIASGSDYVSIHGGPSERIERAIQAIDALALPSRA